MVFLKKKSEDQITPSDPRVSPVSAVERPPELPSDPRVSSALAVERPPELPSDPRVSSALAVERPPELPSRQIFLQKHHPGLDGVQKSPLNLGV